MREGEERVAERSAGEEKSRVELRFREARQTEDFPAGSARETFPTLNWIKGKLGVPDGAGRLLGRGPRGGTQECYRDTNKGASCVQPRYEK